MFGASRRPSFVEVLVKNAEQTVNQICHMAGFKQQTTTFQKEQHQQVVPIIKKEQLSRLRWGIRPLGLKYDLPLPDYVWSGALRSVGWRTVCLDLYRFIGDRSDSCQLSFCAYAIHIHPLSWNVCRSANRQLLTRFLEKLPN